MRLKERCPEAAIRLGRGAAFHIAPSNIPINFAFSWFFSLLAGNANIVRLSSKHFPQVEIFCSLVKSLLPKHPEIQKRTALITYPADDDVTASFCAAADARIIWGGDETISSIRRFPTKPRCVDVTFADRYSAAILDGDAVIKCTAPELRRLAEGFYNDTFLMDQNACSSPHILFWINGSEKAKEIFRNELAGVVSERYELQGMTAVDKFVRLCEDALDRPEAESVSRIRGNLIYFVRLSSIPKDGASSLRGKGGYFYEYDIASLDEAAGFVDEKFQTVTYFGVSAEDIRNVVIEKRLSGIDRIVPVGSAMDIDIIWDGYDLVRVLSRVVDAR
ncbi:MAG: hypothetical protein HUJ86_03440 [Synergistes sp.]|nr:hypothetical protein [Synergistes sp.]